jgi:uridine monophosphate synthetase
VVEDVVVLVDREQGGAELLAQHGLRLHACFTLRSVLEVLRDAGRISGGTHEQVLQYLAT